MEVSLCRWVQPGHRVWSWPSTFQAAAVCTQLRRRQPRRGFPLIGPQTHPTPSPRMFQRHLGLSPAKLFQVAWRCFPMSLRGESLKELLLPSRKETDSWWIPSDLKRITLSILLSALFQRPWNSESVWFAETVRSVPVPFVQWLVLTSFQ